MLSLHYQFISSITMITLNVTLENMLWFDKNKDFANTAQYL